MPRLMSAPPTSRGSNLPPGSVSGSQGHTATQPADGRDQRQRPRPSSRRSANRDSSAPCRTADRPGPASPTRFAPSARASRRFVRAGKLAAVTARDRPGWCRLRSSGADCSRSDSGSSRCAGPRPEPCSPVSRRCSCRRDRDPAMHAGSMRNVTGARRRGAMAYSAGGGPVTASSSASRSKASAAPIRWKISSAWRRLACA